MIDHTTPSAAPEPDTGTRGVRQVTVEDVSVTFDRDPVVDHLSLDVLAGEWVVLIGPNGAGKSTLLRAIAGTVAHAGAITLDGVAVAAVSERARAGHVAMVPQNPVVPPAMTVLDYVLLGRTRFVSYLGVESAHDLQVASDVIDQLDLTALTGRALGALSGGERQRAVLARALAQQAPVLLLDEPTAALDVGHQQHVLELVADLRRDHGLTVVSAMHDLTLAGQYGDRLVLLDGGRAVAAGTADAVLTEDALRRWYGANVRILRDDRGGVVVVPRRVATPTQRVAGPS